MWKVLESTEGSIDRELAQVNTEMEGIQMGRQEMENNHLQSKGQKNSSCTSTPLSETYKYARRVPRMGTSLYFKTGACPSQDSSYSAGRRDTPPTPKFGQVQYAKSNEDGNASTSAYSTGECCRSMSLTRGLSIASNKGKKGFKNSMLCPTSTGTTTTQPVLSNIDTKKQTQTPAVSHDCSSDNYMAVGSMVNKNAGTSSSIRVESNINNNKKLDTLERKIQSGESLQELYMQNAGVMYTTLPYLEHTIQIQQKLFQQQMKQNGTHSRRHKSSFQTSGHSSRNRSISSGNTKQHQHGLNGNQSPNDSPQHVQTNTGQTTQESYDKMERVIKRRSDGTRYITHRLICSKVQKERAKHISEERCCMTTTDDAMSYLKIGKTWSKVRRTMKYRNNKKKLVAKMETLKESDDKKDNVELSQRKKAKRKGKTVFDDFVTVQEMLAHGSKNGEGKNYNPILSVSTM